MLGHIRRCPTSLRRRILSLSNATPAKPSSLAVRSQVSPLCRSQIQQRSFHRSLFAAQAGVAARANEQSHSPSNKDTSKSAKAPLTTFQQLADQGLVDRGIIRTLTASMGINNMTDVQSLTINEALTGTDILAQAKTGTGKTLGFLLPIVQNILQQNPGLAGRSRSYGFDPSDIKALIISPTRELAEQIATEARKVTSGTGIVVQTGVGGTQKNMHLNQMHRQGCHILVGTPGRLKDILSDPRAGVSCPSLNTLVLDEADRLLDLGFWPEIQEIQQWLPSRAQKDRQTLMFSATVPNEIVGLARSVMKPNLHYVRTVQEDETPTTERVTQKLVVVPSLENKLPAVLELCNRELQASQDPSNGQKPFKAIVYFNTTMETDLAGQMFLALKLGNYRAMKSSPEAGIDLKRTNIYSIHSRLTQNARTNAAESFRRSRSGILMSSDVTARGMDFPGVTHVIQVGLPKDARDTYVHRIGRTARAGQEGEGWLIVNDSEVRLVRKHLGNLPLKRDTSLGTTVAAFEDEEVDGAAMAEPAKQHFWALLDAASGMRLDTLTKAYYAMMNAAEMQHDKEEYIMQLNRVAKSQWGLDPPGITPNLARKMGLSNVKGLNYREDSDWGFSRGGGGGRYGRDDPGSRHGRVGGYRRDGPRDAFPPRSGGRGFDQDNFDNAFTPRNSGDRDAFARGGRGVDPWQRGRSPQRSSLSRGGDSRGRSFDNGW